jgi:hypothetical protein
MHGTAASSTLSDAQSWRSPNVQAEQNERGYQLLVNPVKSRTGARRNRTMTQLR